MSTIFLYEDGHGNVVDESGGPEPMDYIVDQNEFIIETIATHTKYLKAAVPNESSLTFSMLLEKPKDEDIRMKETNTKRDYVRYTVQDKANRKVTMFIASFLLQFFYCIIKLSFMPVQVQIA